MARGACIVGRVCVAGGVHGRGSCVVGAHAWRAVIKGHLAKIKRVHSLIATIFCRDMCGQVPYNCAKTKDVRGEFRTFMRSYPDKYDYVLAQVR